MARKRLFEGTVTCSGCHAINRIGSHTCVECGAPLGSVEELREVNGALKRASAWIAGIAWLYRLGAAAYAVATLFAVLALARTDVPLGQGVLVVVLTTLLSVLMLLYTLHIPFRPFAWTLAIALLASSVTLVHAVGPDPLGVALPASAVWTVVSWAALLPALRARHLIAEHKDLYILHHASVNTRRALKGHTREERHERLLRAMRNATRRTWRLSAAAAVLLTVGSAIGTWTVVTRSRPQPFADARLAFETAWNEHGLAAACARLPAEVRDHETARLAGVTGAHWPDGLPQLAGGQERGEDDGHERRVEYRIGELTVTTSWFRSERAWSLAAIELPLPPLEPVIQRFREAWESSTPDAIAAFFSADNREEMLASLESSARLRGWTRFPAILDLRTSGYGEGHASVTLSLAEGKVRSEWYLRADGTWGLSNLKFPKRKKPAGGGPRVEDEAQ